MSRMIETLHRGHGGHRPHAAARSLTVRPRQLVGDRHSASAGLLPDDSLSAVTEPGSIRPRQDSPLNARLQFLKLDERALAAYEHLDRQIERALDLSEPRCLCLTSANVGEGKTTVATNLAFAAAQNADRRVLVVDANMARPQVAKRLGIQPKLGLSEVLVDGLFPAEAIREVSPLGYDVLATGRPSARAVELLSSRRMDVLVRDLKQSYNLIIVDAPHISDESAARMFAQSYDAVYLVIRMFKTRREIVDKAIRLLQRAGVSVRGCILSQTSTAGGFDLHSETLLSPPAESSLQESHSGLTSTPLSEDSSGFAPETLRAIPTPDFFGPQNSDVERFEGFGEKLKVVVEHQAPAGIAIDTVRDPHDSEPIEQLSDSETLRKLETIRPFDDADSLAPPAPDTGTVIAPSVSGPAVNDQEEPALRTIRRHRTAALSLQSEGSAPDPGVPRGNTESRVNSWADNVLAVCGGLLMLAGILYVAVDVVFWF